MALITANIRSHVMDLETQVIVTIPDYELGWHEKPTKLLFLLHGMSNNATAWLRATNIDRYAQERGFIVVMPEVGRSFYSDMAFGQDYYTYLSKELPEICRNIFGFNHKKEDTFIAGVSMGGFGAMKIGLNNPQNFAGIGSLSGAVDLDMVIDMEDIIEENTKLVEEFQGIYGPDIVKTRKIPEIDNIKKLLEDLDKKENKPKIYQYCGTEDFLYKMNLSVKKHIENLNYDYRYFEGPGDHAWKYWDIEIQKCLDYFLEKIISR